VLFDELDMQFVCQQADKSIVLHAHAAKDTYQHANKGPKDPHGQQSYQQFAGIQALQPALKPKAVACHPHIARLLKTATRREEPLTGAGTLAAVPRSKFGRLIAAPVFASGVGSNLYPAFPLVHNASIRWAGPGQPRQP